MFDYEISKNTGKSKYRVEISSGSENGSDLPFKVIVRRFEPKGKMKNIAFWYLCGPSLQDYLDDCIKTWINLKEESDSPAKNEDALISLKTKMNACVLDMNASRKYGYWALWHFSDGSLRLILD